MRYPLAEKLPLENFLRSVEQRNPAMAMIMSDDIRQVALWGLAGDYTKAYESVHRLRKQAMSMSGQYYRMLDLALEELGYSLLDVESDRWHFA